MAGQGNGTTAKIVGSAFTTPTTYSWHLFYRDPAAPGNAKVTEPWNPSVSGNAVSIFFAWHHTSPGYDKSVGHRDSGGWPNARFTSSLLANTWYAVGAVFDGTNIHAFLNGVDEAQIAAGNPVGSNPLPVALGASGGTTQVAEG